MFAFVLMAALATPKTADPVACFKSALALLQANIGLATNLCDGGRGNEGRLRCLKKALPFVSGRQEYAVALCAEGGSEATATCLEQGLRWLPNDVVRVVALCDKGGTPKVVECARAASAIMSSDYDRAIQLCGNSIPPTEPSVAAAP